MTRNAAPPQSFPELLSPPVVKSKTATTASSHDADGCHQCPDPPALRPREPRPPRADRPPRACRRRCRTGCPSVRRRRWAKR